MNRLTEKYLILSLVIISAGCTRKKDPDVVKADVIHYRVEYLHEKAGSIPTKILPDHMTVIFSHSYALNRIEGFFGQFSLSYVADQKRKKVTTLLKIFDKKYVYTGQAGDLPCGIDPMDGMTMKAGLNEKTIAGHRCREYVLSIPGRETLPVFSAEDIRVNSPNITTPYRGHDHVLLQFYTRLSVLDMMLIADSCTVKNIPLEIFSVPDGYQRVSKIKMEKILNELFR